MNKHTKALIFKTIGIGVYLNYYYLTKISLVLFPLVAVYALLFNREMLTPAINVGVCTYCLYFQEILAKWEVAPAKGDKKKAKEIIRSNLTRTIVSILCLLLGIICCYFSWINFIVYLAGGPEVLRSFVSSLM
jgi:uncharacterized membrane protein